MRSLKSSAESSSGFLRRATLFPNLKRDVIIDFRPFSLKAKTFAIFLCKAVGFGSPLHANLQILIYLFSRYLWRIHRRLIPSVNMPSAKRAVLRTYSTQTEPVRNWQTSVPTQCAARRYQLCWKWSSDLVLEGSNDSEGASIEKCASESVVYEISLYV